MRDHVALKAAQAAVTSKLVRVGVTVTLVPGVLVLLAGSAQASPELAADDTAETATGTLAFGPGMVGIAAVVLGIGGLVIGLLRHRRREAGAVPALESQSPAAPRQAERPSGDRAA